MCTFTVSIKKPKTFWTQLFLKKATKLIRTCNWACKQVWIELTCNSRTCHLESCEPSILASILFEPLQVGSCGCHCGGWPTSEPASEKEPGWWGCDLCYWGRLCHFPDWVLLDLTKDFVAAVVVAAVVPNTKDSGTSQIVENLHTIKMETEKKGIVINIIIPNVVSVYYLKSKVEYVFWNYW